MTTPSTTPETKHVVTLKIDPSHSTVEFAVRHLMISTVKGRFTNVEGTVVYDEANPANSTVEATVHLDSIHTSEEKRDTHLRSGDFFEIDKYPTATFKSTKVEKVSDDQFKVSGDLTIRDATQPVVLNATVEGTIRDPWGNQKYGVSATTTLNRKDFGLNWNVALEAGGVMVGDTVKLNIELELVVQS